ncbi:methyl-accepting chemotaxis protein [Telmatospirillum sp.]|uniref:methyl-accepting chemotaxis protein n=1 Tax=Telmatospirillum sp. TaxID=2079197 RepID=UPI00283D1E0F|nr:methyl-accepting chemotaxis protein [Telmatospirillum sp.]MDR3439171.1 methyl-accepting chemotaxis protein [Telmatospirillum sp.]
MSIGSTFAAISLRGRIIGGFTMVVLLMIVTAIISSTSTRQIRDNVNSLETASAASDAVIDFSTGVLDIRRLVTAYLRTMTASDLLAARTGFETTKKRTEKLAEVMGPRAQTLQAGFTAYRTDFDALVDNVKQRQAALSALTANATRMTNITVTLASDLTTAADPAAPAALRLNQNVQALTVAAFHFATTQSSGDFDIIDMEKGRIGREFAVVKAAVPNGGGHAALLNALPQQIEKLLAATDSLLSSSAAVESDFAKVVASGTKLGKDAENLRNEYAKSRTDGITGTLTAADHVLTSGISMAVGATLLAIILSTLVSYSITTLIVGITRVMSGLAAGDLSLAIPDTGRRDQIGDMARAVEVFKANAVRIKSVEAERTQAAAKAEQDRKAALSEMAVQLEESIKSIIDAVSDSALSMRETATSLSGAADRTTSRSTAVAAASEEASVNVQTVASAAEELAASIREIGRQAQDSASIAARAAAQAAETNATIEGLSRAADRIGEVVALINGIASQTNLLALNATIEASRAGDAGKGFAVVASEVKSLAGQTAHATDEIASQIASIQSETKGAVAAIKGIEAVISEINTIASSTASAVDQQSGATAEIARNVQQAASGTADVSSNITGVIEAAAETGEHASEVSNTSDTLSRQADSLEKAIQSFLDGIRAA